MGFGMMSTRLSFVFFFFFFVVVGVFFIGSLCDVLHLHLLISGFMSLSLFLALSKTAFFFDVCVWVGMWM